MRCGECGAPAAEGQRYCGQCGAPLPASCPACGAANPPAYRYCGTCGVALGTPPPGAGPVSYTPPHLADKILGGRGALVGERKPVTVLFADVADYSRLAQRLDPEDLHAVMDRCFRILLDEVHRYEGSVNQFTGDGIMALFGAPIAHEDAPERAVRAGLAIQAALRDYAAELAATRGIDFAMRVGIDTGLVVVGRIGDDLRMDYTAVGDTTNLAARLQTVAAPGTVVVSDHTARLVANRFVLRALGPFALKGRAQPERAHEVVRARPRAPLVAPSEQGLTPLVGRETELAALVRLFGHALEGRGQVALVAGEAGIGKSRLLHELRLRLGRADVAWLEGRCVSFSRDITLLPVADVVKGRFGIEEADDEETVGAKLRDGAAALGVADAEPALRVLVALDPGDPTLAAMDASSRRFAVFEAVKRVLLAVAAERPLVVVVEDLHWVDQASDGFLAYVVDALAASRTFLVCTHRPGYQASFDGRSFVTRLALQPLTREETVRMAAGVLAAPDVPAEIRALVAEKSDGNPFYVEELTKSLVETGALRRTEDGLELARPLAAVDVPNTIQDLILSRIDRLGEAPKRAIQVASVIGREFALRLLQRATDARQSLEPLVGELRALELIYEKSGVPELAYMFKHALTHDVAYESILLQRRRMLHGIIGKAIEELYADRLPEYWETLAHHFYYAEDWPSAFAYLVKAADKAREAFANAEALRFYDRALEVAPRVGCDDDVRRRLLAGKGHAHFGLSEFPEAVAAYRAALALATDDPSRAEIGAHLAGALTWAHEFDEALRAADAARAAAARAALALPEVHAVYVKGFVRALRGDLDGATSLMRESARRAAAGGLSLHATLVGRFESLVLGWRGEYAAARRVGERAMAALDASSDLLTRLECLSNLTIVLGSSGAVAEALRRSDEGLALAERIGDRVWRARLWNTRGWLLAELGVWDAAEEANRRCLEIAASLGGLRMGPELVGNAVANLADLALARGTVAAAVPHLERLAGILAAPGNEWMTWRYGMHYRAAAADAALARGDVAAAREHVGRCLAVAERTRSRRYVVRATRALAAAHAVAGDAAGAARLYERAAAEARALGNPGQTWGALHGWARYLHAAGRRDEAAAVAREALDAVARLAATLPDAYAGTLRATPVVTALGELGS